MDNDSIKLNIARRRSEEGLTQDDMARKLGMVRNSYRNIERGSSRLISEHIDEIAAILKTTPEELVLGYTPSKHDKVLEDEIIKTRGEVSEMKGKYEEMIAERDRRICYLETMIRDLRVIIESKEEIIDLLKKSSVAYSGK